jgi:arylsulfatase A-like enzyme
VRVSPINLLLVLAISLLASLFSVVTLSQSAWGANPGAVGPSVSPELEKGEKGVAQPYNIILIICDQEQQRLQPAKGYRLPAREELARRGVTYTNHYIASAMCSPSRAAMLTGLPPQINGVFDQMEYPYVPSLNPTIPNMGSALKKLGYSTAYFGKFEMDKAILHYQDSVNYSTSLAPYGFDTTAATGDVNSKPDSGYKHDADTAGECVRWLRTWSVDPQRRQTPFFMVASFLNPHDIMYADANQPGEHVQQGGAHHELTKPPKNSYYQTRWQFPLTQSLGESLTGPGMPSALEEYNVGWSGALGFIPADRTDMWRTFYNCYLNMIRDNDASLQQLVDAMDEMGLWENTIVIFTSDHGEMGGSHGGLRGKGPFAYEQNSKVPFIVVHPDYPSGRSQVLTSHLDLLPTLVALTGIDDAGRKAGVQDLPGHDFSSTLDVSERSNVHAIRNGVLFNYVGPQTVDAAFCEKLLTSGSGVVSGKSVSLSELKPYLGKRGFLAFACDGRYKFARYYAPNSFNTPKTLDELFAENDVQLFDLKSDPEEMTNLALEPEKHEAILLRMNALLNELMAKEVGVNDGSFLPAVIRPGAAIHAGQR